MELLNDTKLNLWHKGILKPMEKITLKPSHQSPKLTQSKSFS